MSSFGKYLRNCRMASKCGLRELARKLEISHVFLSDVENGKRGLPIKYWSKLIKNVPSIDLTKLDYLEKIRLPLKIDVSKSDTELQKLAILFEEKLNILSKNQIQLITEILDSK